MFNEGERLTMIDAYSEVVKELAAIFEKKNSDYGSAVDITYLMFGETAQLVRLWDKLLRLTQLHISGVSLVADESVDDTLKDLANYAIIAAAQRAAYEGTVEELGPVMSDFVAKALKKAAAFGGVQ